VNTKNYIDKIIDFALEEDGEDITSSALFSAQARLRAFLVAKEPGIIAGMDIACRTFHRLDVSVSFDAHVSDGMHIHSGQRLASIYGHARAILKAERVVLNFLQRMSGIATLTNKYVERVKGTKARILDTRKTVPGHRVLDRLAVRVGGGVNHRMGLYDMAIIKDNHIDNIGSIKDAVARLRGVYPEIPIEVESRTLEDVREVLQLDVNRVMLDNFSIKDIKKAVDLVDGSIPIEASGNITLDNVAEVALTGVDYISTGAITHSVDALDISMLVEND